MKDIEAIIFDMDGVIFDTERLYLEAWNIVFSGYDLTMTKELYTSVMGRGRQMVKEIFKENYGQDLPVEEMYVERDRVLEELMKNVPLKKGVKELLTYLQGEGYKIALATSSKKERVNYNLNKYNLKNRFNEIVCADDITKFKPNPEIFLKAAEKLGVSNDKCIVIEDSPAGLKAGFAAGMYVINVPDLKVPDKEMLEHSHEIVDNLLEVKALIKKQAKTKAS